MKLPKASKRTIASIGTVAASLLTLWGLYAGATSLIDSRVESLLRDPATVEVLAAKIRRPSWSSTLGTEY